MYCMVNHCAVAKELSLLSKTSKSIIARLNDEQWEIHDCPNVKRFIEVYKSRNCVDVAFIDVTEKQALDEAQHFRMVNGDADILLIADSSMSPIDYIRPDIAASSLLLHPISMENANSVLTAFFRHFFKKGSQKSEGSFEVTSRDGKAYVNYSKILYFEAREKKIFVVTDSREIGFYSTIEEIENSLGGNFKRCHRSFIVNKDRIDRILISQGMIYLDEGAVVPLSRSYRAAFKNKKGL